MFKNILLLTLLLIVGFACVPHRKTVYLQSRDNVQDSIIARKEFVYKVQPKDILYISVTSYNNQLTDFFNVKADRGATNYYMTGYTVDSEGYIHIPVLDTMHVMNLSIQGIQEKLQEAISEYVTGANVIVKLVNFKVTVIGEVKVQGIKNMEGDVFTILEAIAMAGGIEELGDRQNVRLVRKEGTYTRIVNLDLTKRDIISSEYYYLQPNDVIYVEPLRAKSARGNFRTVRDTIAIISGVLISLRKRRLDL
ncbi:MAG: polysaccharide biosynthesis/export family protein [Cytophagaceae bacterium]